MLAAMIQKVHIDYEEVTTKYLCGTKEKRWESKGKDYGRDPCYY